MKNIVINMVLIFPLFCYPILLPAQDCSFNEQQTGNSRILILQNSKITCAVEIKNGRLATEEIKMRDGKGYRSVIDYRLDIQWVAWSAPRKANNADNLITLTSEYFKFVNSRITKNNDGSLELTMDFNSVNPFKRWDSWLNETGVPFLLQVHYKITPDKYYIKRRISFSDPLEMKHLVERICLVNLEIKPLTGNLPVKVIKTGGFGQPVAAEIGNYGAFWGLEYPSSHNTIELKDHSLIVSNEELMGMKITKEPTFSCWVVAALTPDSYIKKWFFAYLDDIRVAPLKPYALYNSWYDLRSKVYPGVTEDYIMNEKNVMKQVEELKTNMIDKYGIKLDAFVLDEGWDTFEGDWILDRSLFPKGLKPIADELKKTNTALGIWYGPTGGYAFRMRRINWMKDHGYEVAGNNEEWNAMMCVAGKNYKKLLLKRVTDMVRDEGISYFKWDGVQYSCNEADHGHNIGRHSTKACVDAIIDMCNAVREINPETYINLTSGIWLSPWWVTYANQIWMCGMDYGFAEVPSLYKRDASITYKDIVLYENFYLKDLWFPVSNLMTHGTIKAKLENVGGKIDPLDKFADDVIFYLSRGVTMYELYISPTVMNDNEWYILSQSLKWARDRFDILKKGYMIGGNPSHNETYGYIHCNGSKGIIAARNPIVNKQTLTVSLDPAFEIDPKACNLVLEKVYPVHWISPVLYSAGATIDLPLEGFESAVYELYPLDSAQKPLPAGCIFDEKSAGNEVSWNIFEKTGEKIKILNPELLGILTIKGSAANIDSLNNINIPSTATAKTQVIQKGSNIHVTIDVPAESKDFTMGILYENSKNDTAKLLPFEKVMIDSKEADVNIEKKDGTWYWYSLLIPEGRHQLVLTMKKGRKLNGTLQSYALYLQKQNGITVTAKTKKIAQQRITLPSMLEKGYIKKVVKTGEIIIK